MMLPATGLYWPRAPIAAGAWRPTHPQPVPPEGSKDSYFTGFWGPKAQKTTGFCIIFTMRRLWNQGAGHPKALQLLGLVGRVLCN